MKTIRNSDDVIEGFELILNETKLSKAAPFTTRQVEFIEHLEKGTIKFITRSKKTEISDLIKQGSSVKIKKYIKAIGNGTENASNIKFEKIF